MQIRGYIDGIFGEALRGWVVDVDDPDRPLRVAGRFDGAVLEATEADEERDDLARAGIGTGLGGFRLQLDDAPQPGGHELVVLIEGTTVAVPLAPDFRVLDHDGGLRDDVELYEERGPAPIEPAADGDRPADALLLGEADWLFACPAAGFDLLRGMVRPQRDIVDALLERLREPPATLVAVLPDKLFVYPERIPPTMPILPAGRLAEHLAARAQDDDALHVLDLLPTMLRARAHGRVFSRSGLAPTPVGAFHAYRAVAKALSLALPALRPCPVAAVRAGAERPVDVAEVAALYSWHGTGLRSTGRPAPSAGALEAQLVGFEPPATTGRPSLALVHDMLVRPVAELLAAHGEPSVLVAHHERRSATAAQPPDAVVWVVSDAALVALASGAS